MNFRKMRFTLIELIVSLAVFAILAALVMQFFSGAQRLWLASEQRSNSYAEARASMEVVNELLASLVFCEGMGASGRYDGFFRLDNDIAGESRLFFMTKTKMALPQAANEPKNDTRFVGILRGANSGSDINSNPYYRLYLTVFCDCDDCNPNKSRERFLYAGLFTPYGVYDNSTSDTETEPKKIDGRQNAKDKLSGSGGKLEPASAVHKSVLAERVLDFSITAIRPNAAQETPGDDIATPPAMLQIQITQMDTADNLKKWSEISDGAGKNTFKQEHSRTFTRAFYLGNR